MITHKEIKIKTEYIAFHNWEDAPEDIKYLRNAHRHKFYVEVVLEISHMNRDLEFHQQLTILNEQIDNLKLSLEFNSFMSCEMMAEFLYNNLYFNKDIYSSGSIEISEDNECSGKIYFDNKLLNNSEINYEIV